MTSRRTLTWIIGLAIVALSGVVYTSNVLTVNRMRSLYTAGANSATGNNLLALPYVPDDGLEDSQDLLNDLGGFDATLSASRFLRQFDSYGTDTPNIRASANTFNLIPGEAYLIQMLQDVDYLVIGEHDPGLMISLDTTGTNGSSTGFNIYAPPYQSPATMASDLVAEIDTAAGVDAVVSISRFEPLTGSWETYLGQTPANDFELRPGEGYLIQVAADVTFLPEWK